MPGALQTALFLAVIVIDLVIGLLVLYKDPRSIVNRSFAIFLFGLATMSTGFFFLSHQFSFAYFDKPIHAGGLMVLFGLMIFSQVFPSGRMTKRKLMFFALPYLLIVAVLPFNLLIRSASFDAAGIIQPINGPLLFPYMVFSVVSIAVSFFFLIRNYRHAAGRQRSQMRYLFTGFVFLLICLFVFDLLLPLFGIPHLSILGNLSSVVFVWLTATAIIKHELLDVRIIIQRGLIYAVLLGIIALVYVLMLQLVGYFLGQMAGMTGIIGAGITTVVGVFSFRPLEDYFRKATDPIFFKDRYDYPKALHELSHALHTNISQADIIDSATRILKTIFKTVYVRFHLAGNDAPPEPASLETALSLPIVFEDKRIGRLDLGAKRSGDGYTAVDKQLLATFICQAAVALEKGRLFKQVEEYNSELESIIEKRTDEIKRLHEDQQQAMVDISHNLQTPLAIINGELDLLGDLPVHTDKIQAVKRSIHEVSQRIRQILHLAKIDHRAFTVEVAAVDLSAMVRGKVEYFEVMAAEKGVRMDASVADGVHVIGNEKLLGELLTNLVTNAIKYRRHDADENVIDITLTQKGKHARLVVVDNGIGIKAEDLPHIFTRFYRGSGKQKTPGTGLGLAICKKIAEKHGGTIMAESIRGQRTAVTVMLPLNVKDPKAPSE